MFWVSLILKLAIWALNIFSSSILPETHLLYQFSQGNVCLCWLFYLRFSISLFFLLFTFLSFYKYLLLYIYISINVLLVILWISSIVLHLRSKGENKSRILSYMQQDQYCFLKITSLQKWKKETKKMDDKSFNHKLWHTITTVCPKSVKSYYQDITGEQNWQLKMVNMHFKMVIIGQSHVDIPVEIIMPNFPSKIG